MNNTQLGAMLTTTATASTLSPRSSSLLIFSVSRCLDCAYVYVRKLTSRDRDCIYPRPVLRQAYDSEECEREYAQDPQHDDANEEKDDGVLMETTTKVGTGMRSRRTTLMTRLRQWSRGSAIPT